MGCTTSLEVEQPREGVYTPPPHEFREKEVQTTEVLPERNNTQKRKEEELLLSSTLETALKFPPPFFQGKCLSVYDGDTFTLGVVLNEKVYRFQVRTFGYDSPEIRTRDLAEKKAGLEAKRVMSERILGKMLDLENKGQDKYGRLLLSIRDAEGEINEWMVRIGHGRPYFGKKKEAFVATKNMKETTVVEEGVEIEFVD